MWTLFMRLRTPQVTITIHPCFSKDAAGRGRFDTYQAQTTHTRTRRRPITFRPLGRTSPDLWVHHQHQTGDAMFTLTPERETRCDLT
jgi:hypothetical protein